MAKNTIGKVSATERTPTTAESFMFWLGDEELVAPFDIVEASNREGSTTYGQVTAISYISDSTSHLGSYVSSDFGKTEDVANTLRLGTTYVEADVLTNNKNVFMPLRDSETVRFADEEGVSYALGLDRIDPQHQVPAGFVTLSNGLSISVSLDEHFLVGPEAAHLNMSGISGLASKTSYIMFIMRALQQRCEDAAFIVLNVKGEDLLHIHLENSELQDSDITDWERCGLEPTPFSSVQYFYPYQEVQSTGFANTLANRKTVQDLLEAELAHNFVYTFEEDKAKLDLLFSNVEDPNFTIDSIISEIEAGSEFRDVTTWQGLLETVKRKAQAGAAGEKHIPTASWRRFDRLLRLYMSDTAGIYQSSVSEHPAKHQVRLESRIAAIKPGEVFVVDIANLDEPEQCLVFGDIIKTVRDAKSGELGQDEPFPKRVVIFVDELNKYAPTSLKSSPIIRDLLEITERGRSQGVALFSAQQFKSAVHDRVKGNCGTHSFGRTNVTEISKPDYKSIPKSYTHMMTRLKQGELIVQHPPYPRLLKVTFPRPCYYQPK